MNKLVCGSIGVAACCLSASAFADNAVPVPEPGTLGLLVAGVAGILAVRRLSRK